MAIRTLPSRALIHQLLRYNPETGDLVWLPRTPDLIFDNNKRAIWNSRFAGSVAGYVRPTMKGLAYLHIGIQGTIFKAHRLVWVYVRGEPVPDIIDHIDHDPLNNRIENLRAATMSQNRANSFTRRESVSGIKGIRITRQNKFMVRIKQTSFGTFATLEEAKAAYKEATTRLFGDFARVHHR